MLVFLQSFAMFGGDQVRQSVQQHLGNIPVVLVNGELELPNAYSVLADEERGTEDCVALLAENGRKNMAYLMDVGTPSNFKKCRGFCTGLLRQGLGAGESRVFNAPGAAPAPGIPSSGGGRPPANCWMLCRMWTEFSAPQTCSPSAAWRS